MQLTDVFSTKLLKPPAATAERKNLARLLVKPRFAKNNTAKTTINRERPFNLFAEQFKVAGRNTYLPNPDMIKKIGIQK